MEWRTGKAEEGDERGKAEEKIDGREGMSSPGLGPLLGSVWQVLRRPKDKARRTPQLALGLASRPRAYRDRSLLGIYTWHGRERRDSGLAHQWEHRRRVG